jgi:hypothetical protein
MQLSVFDARRDRIEPRSASIAFGEGYTLIGLARRGGYYTTVWKEIAGAF